MHVYMFSASQQSGVESVEELYVAYVVEDSVSQVLAFLFCPHFTCARTSKIRRATLT